MGAGMWRDGFIAVDWGTTNRRAYRIGSGGACEAKAENMTQGQARALANSILRATQQGQ